VKKSASTSQSRKAAANHDDPEIRRVWKSFSNCSLPDKDQRARYPFVNSLVATNANGNA